MLGRIAHELKHHAPFTLLGTVIGIGVMLGMHYGKVPHDFSEPLFEVFHPLHVLLSAMVTGSMYKLHSKGRFVPTLLIGFVGAIGIATVSDSIIPFLGEKLLNLPHAQVHAGFLEQPYVVSLLAVLGVLI